MPTQHRGDGGGDGSKHDGDTHDRSGEYRMYMRATSLIMLAAPVDSGSKDTRVAGAHTQLYVRPQDLQKYRQYPVTAGLQASNRMQETHIPDSLSYLAGVDCEPDRRRNPVSAATTTNMAGSMQMMHTSLAYNARWV